MTTPLTQETQLQQLRKMTHIVADTGDLDAIITAKPVDATTNPSLVLKAANSGKASYQAIIKQSVEWAKSLPTSIDERTRAARASQYLAVLAGVSILQHIPGRISTEVDARLSFDTRKTVENARRLIQWYKENGISEERVLIKIAATWEGIRAAEQLEREGIHCNLTLIFSFAQAQACAEAGVTLISPFVGRIWDWYQAHPEEATDGDPGVASVARIFQYFKKHGYQTSVMGASFRKVEQIQALAGCDYLTISPALLEELDGKTSVLERCLDPSKIEQAEPKAINEKLSEGDFRWALNEDAMGTEKLSQGIRLFAADQESLEAQLLSEIK